MNFFELFIIYIIIIFLIGTVKGEGEITINIKPKTGIINKKFGSSKKEFSFQIDCEVDQNITNNITKIDIIIPIKNLDNDKTYSARCNLIPVRLINNEQTVDTSIYCIINLTEYANNELNKDSNIIINLENDNHISTDYTSTTSTAVLNFTNFGDISAILSVNDLTLIKLDEEYCKNNNYLFEIDSQTINRPLLSTICYIALFGDTDHPIAKCAIPMKGNTIKCFVDVSQKKYKKGDHISIKKQELVPCENGQHIKIDSDISNTISINEDCGEIINNSNEYIYLYKILFVLFFLYLL